MTKHIFARIFAFSLLLLSARPCLADDNPNNYQELEHALELSGAYLTAYGLQSLKENPLLSMHTLGAFLAGSALLTTSSQLTRYTKQAYNYCIGQCRRHPRTSSALDLA